MGRPRGRKSIDVLPSGAYRVRVYAGVDPPTGNHLMLTERVPAGRAPAARKPTRYGRCSGRSTKGAARGPEQPSTSCSTATSRSSTSKSPPAERTRATSSGTRPVLGPLPLGRVDGEVLDSFYAQLRRPTAGSPAPAASSQRASRRQARTLGEPSPT